MANGFHIFIGLSSE